MSQTKTQLIDGLNINTSVPDDSLVIDSSGNVGIGTSSPGVKTHIYDASNVSLKVESGGANYTEFNLTNTSASYTIGIRPDVSNALVIRDANATANRVAIDSSGNVGIGTTTPSAKLTITETSNANSIVIRNADTNGSNLQFGINTGIPAAYIQSTKDGSGTAQPLAFYGASSEWGRFDTSGRLLVGTSSTSTNSRAVFQGRAVSDTTGQAVIYLQRGSSGVGIFTGGQGIGDIYFADSNSNVGAAIYCASDGVWSAGGSDYPSRLMFSTTADGASSPTERMRISNAGNLFAYGVYDVTTASAANVNSASDGGLRRSTSSIKYKQDVETIEDSYSDALLQCRPVWYRSTCKDDCVEHSWWGFIAEEVAEIDPRLVHWKTTEPVVQENGSLEHVPCDPEPEGVAYDRFVPHLLNLIKRQKEQIEAMEARLSAFESA